MTLTPNIKPGDIPDFVKKIAFNEAKKEGSSINIIRYDFHGNDFFYITLDNYYHGRDLVATVYPVLT